MRGLIGILSAPCAEMESPARHNASAVFYAGGAVSGLGRSPTRMAEVLATGRPVVADPGVGEVAEIIRARRVGVLVEDLTPQALATALDALEALLADPDLPVRCRRVAETLFSLAAGTEAYRRLYTGILAGDAAPRPTIRADGRCVG